MTHRAATLLAIAGAVALAPVIACGGARTPTDRPTSLPGPDAAPAVVPPDAAPTEPGRPDAAPVSTYAVPAHPINVARLTPGKRPTRLRYIAGDTTQVIDRVTDQALSVRAGGREIGSSITGHSVGLTLAATADGNATLQLDRSSAQEADAAAKLDDLVGARVTWRIDDRGRPGDATITSSSADARSAAANDELLRDHSAAIVLPEEPIGVGGTWRVTTRRRYLDLDAELATTYTLVARTGEELTVTGTVTITAPRQPVTTDGETHLAALEGRGTVEATVRLSRPAPVISFTEHDEVHIEATAQTDALDMVLTASTRQTTRDR